ncbi:MAG: class I SAM-dependent methyltransferase, partial [Anaerolineae bacterium]|nr:class I SAM-dependent methyltransferase [Anaerolineae bacterium]
AGGGPGRYALALARAGFPVHMLDLSSVQVDFLTQQMQQEPASVQACFLGAETADLRDLSRFAADCFDAVVCLGGPLTHLPLEADRVSVVRELARVTRPGGLLFLTGVGRLALMRYMLNYQSEELLHEDIPQVLRDGNLTGPTATMWHFFRADELRALAEGAGLRTRAMRGLQGLSSGCEAATNRLAEERPEMWAAWQRVLLLTAEDPAVVDGAEHILWVGVKPDR